MKQALVLRLSVMMFFQYAVWGIWLPVAARFMKATTEQGGLGFSDSQIGWILGSAGSIGALAAPFLAGQIADRYFRAERVLACLLLVGGLVQWYMSNQTGFHTWLRLSIVYSVLYMPTLALSNSVAFAHLTDADRQFPKVRVWGTLGWIAASWIFPWVWLQSDLQFQKLPPFLAGEEAAGVTGLLIDSLKFSCGISFVYALYCLTLPATPPKRDKVESFAVAKAFGLFSKKSFAVLVVAGLLVSTIHQIYFIQTGPFFSYIGLRDADIGPAMTVGQFSEILVMAGLGFFLLRLGFRAVLTFGALAYLLRYGIWAVSDDPTLVVASQALHGVCFACFFVAAYIYVDRLAPKDVRHSAQNVFNIIMLGGGPILGGILNGWLGEQHLAQPIDGVAQVQDYASFWWTLAGIGGVAMVAVLMFFRDETREERVG